MPDFFDPDNSDWNMKRLPTFIILTLVLIGFSSCKKPFEPPAWDTDILTPIAKSTLTINDIAGTNVTVNADTTVSIVYTQDLYQFTVDSLIQLSIAPFVRNVKIDTLGLSDQTVVRSITLADIAHQVGPPMEGYIIANHGNNVPLFGDINGVTAGPFVIDASSFLTTATLESGTMEITIDNGLPVEIQNVTFEIRNQSDNSLILTDNFPSIPSNSQVMSSTDLSGLTIEGILEITITNMDIIDPGSPIPIDTTDAITATMSLLDLSVSEATAIFPAQVIVNNTDSVELEDMGDVRLKAASIASGQVEIEVLSTIEDSLFFTYTIPDASLGGVPFSIDVEVPPAPPNDTARINLNYDFTGYDFVFTNNKFANSIIGSIDSTGEIRTISKSDSVYINLQIVDLTPSYAQGYFGQDTFSVADVSTLDIFNNVVGGSIDLEQSEITLSVTNGLGIPAEADINNITSVNNGNATAQVLNTGGLSLPLSIAAATDGPYIPSITNLAINDVNSNSSQLLEILPDELMYDLEIQTNPGGFPGTCDDFAYQGNSLDVSLNVEVPLSIVADSLALSDTTTLNTAIISKPEEIKDGTFSLLIDNGYPLDMNLKIYFLDGFDVAYDSLISTSVIAAASVDGSLLVDEITRTKVDFEISEDRMADLLGAYKIAFWLDFTTNPNGPHIQIYDDYAIDIKLIGDFIYRFE